MRNGGRVLRPDFFSAKEFPTIHFKSNSVKSAGENKFEVTGDLTLHGVTKPITFPAKVTETADGVQLESKFTIDRTDFKMTYGPGKVDNPVTITVNINAKSGHTKIM